VILIVESALPTVGGANGQELTLNFSQVHPCDGE